MARRTHPLVPLGLFRTRAFATINLATFLIYGALYVTFSYQALLFQGVLGYTALGGGRGRRARPASCLRSCRPGSERSPGGSALAGSSSPGRCSWPPGCCGSPGSRGLGGLEGSRSTSPPRSSRRSSVFIDVLPAILLFGIGISLVVAPLTSTLMSSIPSRFSGLGSAINNAISRVGQPLLGAIIFIAISATFYADARAAAPELDVTATARPPRVPAAEPAARGGHRRRR